MRSLFNGLKYGLVSAGLILASSVHLQAQDVLITNANGYHIEDGKLVRFDTLLVRSGRVAAAGPASALEQWGEGIRNHDVNGATLLPGLIDAHGHVFGLGHQLLNVNLVNSKSLADAQARVAAGLSTAGGWVRGGGWNQVIWGLGRFPTAEELDKVTGDKPAYLRRVDGHAAWVNSKALEMAGITKDTPDPQGGLIVRDADGNATGVLVDAAMDLVEAIIPAPSDAQRRKALDEALSAMASLGMTGVHDAGITPEQWAIYRSYAGQKKLTSRIYAMIGGAGEVFDILAQNGPQTGLGEDRLFMRSVKLYADGALGSRGAALHWPYSDDPDNHGLLFVDDVTMVNQISRVVSRGFQANVHAIGDKANTQVLDAFETVLRHNGAGLRHRIEHAQVMRLEDIPRMKRLELIASMQPTHATSDKNMAEDRLGHIRIKGAYAWRTILEEGIVIASGSDFPVEPPNPFYGLHAAVTRRDRNGDPLEGWYANQKMTVEEALKSFTSDAAYAAHMEDKVGSLETGKWGDFILIDQDIFEIDPQDIWKTKVLETWLAGERVYAAQ